VAREALVSCRLPLLLNWCCRACRYLKLKFTEIPEAKRCLDELQNFREDVTVKHFTKDDSESTWLVVLGVYTRVYISVHKSILVYTRVLKCDVCTITSNDIFCQH